jgi:hypothetical protein
MATIGARTAGEWGPYAKERGRARLGGRRACLERGAHTLGAGGASLVGGVHA